MMLLTNLLRPLSRRRAQGIYSRENFISEAPLTIVACTDNKISKRYGDRGAHLYAIQDVSASIMNMILVAHELGLGTVWGGAFDEWQVFEILKLSQNLRPVAIIPV